MCEVDTVRGPVACDKLGLVLPHEHIFVTDPQLEENYPGLGWDEALARELAGPHFEALEQRGVGTIVDLTVMGLGRSIERVRQVASHTSVHVIAATGYYTMSELPSYFESWNPGAPAGLTSDPDPLPTLFLRDLEEGIAGTGVRAGVLKVSSDARGIGPAVARVFEAAAIAQRRTGVPVFTHSDAPSRSGIKQLEVLVEHGVHPSRIVIGHCDNARDLGYLRELLDAGCTIGVDQFGFPKTASDEERLELVTALCELGYADRVVLSHDSHVMVTKYSPATRARVWPTWSPTRISDVILPELARRGIDGPTLQLMTRTNPARLLARHSITTV